MCQPRFHVAVIFLTKRNTQKVLKATLSRLLSSKFEKSFIQSFIRYHSHFLLLSGTEDLPWPMDYYLCNYRYIHKWLDFQVFSDKDYKLQTVGPVSQPFTVHTTLWDAKKGRAYSSRCCRQASFHSLINVLGEIANGPIAAANGACIC